MKILITLEDYTGGKELIIAEILKSELIKANFKCEIFMDSIEPRKRLAIITNEDPFKIAFFLRKFPEISRIIPLYHEHLPLKLDLIKSKSIEALNKIVNLFGKGSFKVEVKKLGEIKKLKFTSLDLCRIIGSEIESKLGLRVNVKDPNYIVYIQLSKGGVDIGVTLGKLYRKERKSLPLNFFSNYIVVFENPKTVYELMDMLRLCASMNIELRIVNVNRNKFERAINAIGGLGKKVNYRIYDKIDDAIKDLIPIGFSSSAILNEEDFIKFILKAEGKIGLLIGNEFEGLSIEARHKAKILIRLGPKTGFSMRSSTATAYVLGLIASLYLSR